MLLILSANDGGDHEKFESLYNKYLKKLYYFVHVGKGLSQHDAEDILQETFTRISKNLHKIDQIDSGQTHKYIYTILENEIIRWWRKMSAYQSDVTFDEALQTAEKNDILIDRVITNSEYERLVDLIDSLDDIDRFLIDGQLRRGLSIKQLAAETGLSETYVSVKLSRIKKRLKEQMLAKEAKQHG